MDTFFGFIIGLAIGLAVSIPLAVGLVYFMIMRKVNDFLAGASTTATGIAGKLINHAVKSHFKQ